MKSNSQDQRAPKPNTRGATYMLLGASLLSPFAWSQAKSVAAPSITDVQRSFVSPPDDSRIMMRWWWFGPGVVKPELKREMLAMKAGGIGGFEIQPVYPLALNDASKNFRNLPYLSPEFLDDLKFTAATAHENGMRVDLTLASGWPYGGPHVPIDEAASKLRMVAEDLAVGSHSVPAPSIGNGEKLIAVFAGSGTAKQYDAANLKRTLAEPKLGRYEVPHAAGAQVVLFFIASRTGQQVKRAAVDADGFVLDHFSRSAIDHHLSLVADPLIKAFGANPPYAVFSDSLEVYSADWTDDLLPEFAKRRGYDLTPHLPELCSGQGPNSAALRHDWGQTLTELVNERYLTPVRDWAKAHNTRFRSQTYGEPAVSLSSSALADLPEGEGPQWRSFSFTRLATSASHLYGRPVTSAETWTWLHSPAFHATPLDMKAEADRFFLQGVNQLIGHGWPYTPPGVAEPGWAFYAAAVFNDHNPWWPVMPEVTKYLQRMSYLLRQGKPVNDVAVLLPNDDAYTEFKPGHVALSAEMAKYITPVLVEQILDSGYGLDYIDAGAIKALGIHYPVLVMPHVERLSPDTLKAIAAYEANGGKVITIGSLPSQAPGFLHADEITAEVKQLAEKMHGDAQHTQVVHADEELGTALKQALKPDVQFTGALSDIGFIHRKLADADIYFVVNSSNHVAKVNAVFRSARKFASLWDPFKGTSTQIDAAPLAVELEPYGSRVVVFTDVAQASPAKAFGALTDVVDLAKGWKIDFPALSLSRTADVLKSWTDDEATRYFSGEAVYTKGVHVSAADLRSGKLVLDFGPGAPVEANPAMKSGMRALLESPVREVAVVKINGKAAGSVWHPPYQLDITSLLHEGENTIEIHVDNLAINLLAGRAPTDYRLLWARYGQRAVPQDMDNLQTLPSGILGPVHLQKAEALSTK